MKIHHSKRPFLETLQLVLQLLLSYSAFSLPAAHAGSPGVDVWTAFGPVAPAEACWFKLFIARGPSASARNVEYVSLNCLNASKPALIPDVCMLAEKTSFLRLFRSLDALGEKQFVAKGPFPTSSNDYGILCRFNADNTGLMSAPLQADPIGATCNWRELDSKFTLECRNNRPKLINGLPVSGHTVIPPSTQACFLEIQGLDHLVLPQLSKKCIDVRNAKNHLPALRDYQNNLYLTGGFCVLILIKNLGQPEAVQNDWPKVVLNKEQYVVYCQAKNSRTDPRSLPTHLFLRIPRCYWVFAASETMLLLECEESMQWS
ncbi:hypothetical protein BCR37DRAFT_379916 [Protomyces lactucae-debilis]|uniref:Uncharacterized protein n=1 Tax=Protomyces lactucae-debilis TaxID=2754530 RepID=A0A1Y2FDK9_PROLT|nr:uncharacterized protein BCR37DRAFT_379916 [Protomyces lactucae-debilis]ORY81999.1 hypothetical protein BCR37DRAFT_379916 [Protomyces lactucae-debilis]